MTGDTGASGPKHDEALTASELGQVLGAAPGRWSRAELTHNRGNAVTAGIWRVTAGGTSFILKVLGRDSGAAAPGWAASEEPRHWNYWQREPLAYRTGLVDLYADAGVGAPALLASFDRPDGDIALWLEDVAGTPGTEWDIATHARFGAALGRGQGAYLAGKPWPEAEWLSQDFLPTYVASKPYDYDLLRDDAAWDVPLVREAFPMGLREGLLHMHAARDRLYAILAAAPQVPSHLDMWPRNVIAREDGRFALLDWAFAGAGAVGEDVGNHIPDSVFDLFMPAVDLPRLERAVFEGYVAGLRDVGWAGDERVVRMAVCASAIKYDWLAPRMLALAGTGEQRWSYGASDPAEGQRRYREGGTTLLFLTHWAAEALRLAEEQGET